MQAFESIVSALISALSAALLSLLGLVAILFPTTSPPPAAPVTSTIILLTAETTSAPATTTSATAPPVKAESAPASTSVASPSAPTAVIPTPVVTQTPTPQKSEEQVNAEARGALVNILCNSKAGISGISGSGVIIDSRGLILTNAHIGQYFLLKNYLAPNNVECVIRVGSPAERRYTATLMFMPAAWVEANAHELKSQQAMGTGEHDYAFLLITGRTDPSAALPSSFAALEMDATYPDIGVPMLLAAYPAGFLSGEIIEKSLYASSAVTYTTQLFSFDEDTTKVDLFSIGGTVVSQAGSSGGAVVRLGTGKLAGVIATATTGTLTSARDLRAVTLSHIDKSLAEAGEGGIATLLSSDLKAKAASFNTKGAPALTAVLEAALRAQ